MVIIVAVGFSVDAYASENYVVKPVSFLNGFFDSFKRVPSDIEPFYMHHGEYIYAGGKLELKDYELNGRLRIEKPFETPTPNTSNYYQKLRIYADEIVISGDIVASNYSQLHARKNPSNKKGNGNITLIGEGKLETRKIADKETGLSKECTVISCEGDFTIKNNAKLNLGKETTIDIKGDFIAKSNALTDLHYGEIKIGKNFDLRKKFVSDKDSMISLYSDGEHTIKGSSECKVATLKLSFDTLKHLNIKKKLFDKSYFQCNKIVFDYISHSIPINVIDKYFDFQEIYGKSEGKHKQVTDYAKSFLYTIIYSKECGKININKTFLHVETNQDEKSSIYTINIQDKPTSIAVGNKIYKTKISLVYTGIGTPLKKGSAAFAELKLKLENGETYDYLVISKQDMIDAQAFIDSLKAGASEKIKDLAKDVLMDQVASDLLAFGNEFEWKAGVVTGTSLQGKDLMEKLKNRLQDWNKMVKDLPEYEGIDIETIKGREEHVNAPERIDESSEDSDIESLVNEAVVTPQSTVLSNEDITTLLNDYVSQKESMYGKSCTFTLQRKEEADNGSGFDRWWDGISEGVVLGYAIEDFDSDDVSEMLLVTLCEEQRIQLEMYEVVDGAVTLAESKYTDTNSSYGTVELPCGSRTDGGTCGMLSCFIQESDKRIFLQSSDSFGLVADGCDTFIVSSIYRDGKFEEYKVTYDVGSSIDESIPRLNQELSDIGVPNPDFHSIFYSSTPLVDCYDGGVHEILRAEQETVEIARKGNARSKIVTQMYFFSPNEILNGKMDDSAWWTITIDEFGNGFNMTWDEFKQIHGEPNSSEVYYLDNMIYNYYNTKCLGSRGEIKCGVNGEGIVTDVSWSTYTQNDELYHELVDSFAEKYDTTGVEETADTTIQHEGFSVDDYDGMVLVSYIPKYNTTSFSWFHNRR